MPLDKIKFSTASSIGATRQESGVESFAKFITSASETVQKYGETKYTYDQRIKSENETDDLIFSLEAANKFDKDKLANNYNLMSGVQRVEFLKKHQAENQDKYVFNTEKYKAAFEASYIKEYELADIEKNKDTVNTITNEVIPSVTNNISTARIMTKEQVDLLATPYKDFMPGAKKLFYDGLFNTVSLDLSNRTDEIVNGGYKTEKEILSLYPLFNGGKDSVNDPEYLIKINAIAEKLSASSKENEKNKLASQLGVIIDPKERDKIQKRLTDLGVSPLESLKKEIENAEKMAEFKFRNFEQTGDRDSLIASIAYSNVSGKGIPDLTKSIEGLGSRILTLGSTKEGVADVRKTLTTLKMALSLGMNKNIIKGDDAIELSAFLEYNNIYDVDKASNGDLVKFINLYSTAKKNNYKPMTDAQIDDLIELNGKGSANYTQVAQLSKKYSRFFDPNTAFAMAVRTAEAKPYLTVTDRESVTPGIDMSGTGIRDNEQFTEYIEAIERQKKVDVLGVASVGNQYFFTLSGDNTIVVTDTQIQQWVAGQAKIKIADKELKQQEAKNRSIEHFVNFPSAKLAKAATNLGFYNKNTISHLINREGYSDKMYKDKFGYDTIGFGTKIDPKDETGKRRLEIINASPGKKITKEMAQKWMYEDFGSARKSAEKLATYYGTNDVKFVEALAVVNYQMGNSGIELKFPSVHKLLKSNDKDKYSKAAAIIKESLWAKQTPTRTKDFINALNYMHDKQ